MVQLQQHGIDYLILLVFNFDQDAQVTKVNVYTNILRVKYNVLTYSVLLDFTLFIQLLPVNCNNTLNRDTVLTSHL